MGSQILVHPRNSHTNLSFAAQCKMCILISIKLVRLAFR